MLRRIRPFLLQCRLQPLWYLLPFSSFLLFFSESIQFQRLFYVSSIRDLFWDYNCQALVLCVFIVFFRHIPAEHFLLYRKAVSCNTKRILLLPFIRNRIPFSFTLFNFLYVLLYNHFQYNAYNRILNHFQRRFEDHCIYSYIFFHIKGVFLPVFLHSYHTPQNVSMRLYHHHKTLP